MSEENPESNKGMWVFSDGHSAYMTDQEAEEYMKKTESRRVYYKRTFSNARPGHKPLVRDGTGFKPHFNHGLGMWVDTKRQYYGALKEKGLIEMGNEPKKPQTTPAPKPYITDEVVKEVNQMDDKNKLTESDLKQMGDKGG